MNIKGLMVLALVLAHGLGYGQHKAPEDIIRIMKERLPFSELSLQQGGSHLKWIEGSVASGYQKQKCEQWAVQYMEHMPVYVNVSPPRLRFKQERLEIGEAHEAYNMIKWLLDENRLFFRENGIMPLYSIDEHMWELLGVHLFFDKVGWVDYDPQQSARVLIDHADIAYEAEILTDNLIKWVFYKGQDVRGEYIVPAAEPCRVLWIHVEESAVVLNLLKIHLIRQDALKGTG